MQNLDYLIQKLVDSDNGVPLSDEDFTDLAADIKTKVDSINDFISKCEFEAQRLDETYIKPITARKQALLKSSDNLKKWVINTMDKNDFPVLHGDIFTIKLHEKEVLDCESFDIDSEFYLQNKEICRRKYELDKRSLLDQIKKGKEFAFAKLGITKYIRFSVKKGAK